MKTTEFQNEQTQLDEGPCDIALPSEIKKMPADVFTKYAIWKRECEREEAEKKSAHHEDVTENDGDELENFLSIYQYVDENHEGSSRDIFKMAISAYEDEYGEVSDEVANKWFEVVGDEREPEEDVWAKNFKRQANKRLRQKKYRDDQQADEFGEGHRTLPPIDTERYTERKGLEGPIRARNGKVVYYDPKEGQYYDPDTDIYISNDEWEGMNENFKGGLTKSIFNDPIFRKITGRKSMKDIRKDDKKNKEKEKLNASSPAPDGPDYKEGDLVVMPDGRSYTLDEYDDGIWWAVDNDGGDIEFEPGTELHHEPMSESEEDNVSGALDTMRQHFHDYNHDPSDRWEKYKQYRNQRKQISKRAKDLK